MKSPQQIKEQARRLWDSGRVLRAVLGLEPELFPYAIPLGRPSARDLLESFAQVRAWKESIEAGCACHAGRGYRIEYEELNHRQLGQQRLPTRVVFDTPADLVGLLGKGRELARFAALHRDIRARQPSLAEWVAANPLRVLASAESWPRLLAVLDYFQAHPRPGAYLRELVIPGVDSKFIEGQRPLLAELLGRVLPGDAIDAGVIGPACHGFERRFGLRYDEPAIRLRLLDPALAAVYGGLDDLTIPQGRFLTLAPPCERVVVTENKVNGLSFPPLSDGLVIFGLGYGVEVLRDALWLRDKAIFYWGDIDTHGFAILSRLREYLPHARSLLMDAETFHACSTAWVHEDPAKRFTGKLAHLTDAEQALYQALRDDRFGVCLRLEQERVPFTRVQAWARSEGTPRNGRPCAPKLSSIPA